MVTISKQLIHAKLKAGFIHFLVSFSIFLMVLSWVWFVAYPDVYFSMAGAVQGLTLVFLVDVVLGPLLSFLVYNPKKPKKEIISDFAIIGLVQLGALVYGLNTLNQEHPKAVIVYKNSSATVVNARELADIPEFDISYEYSKWGKLPVAVYAPDISKSMPYQALGNSLNVIVSTDQVVRRDLHQHSPNDLATLEQLEKQHGQGYVIGVMAKYNGAYFFLDKEFNLITKFGEKPVS